MSCPELDRLGGKTHLFAETAYDHAISRPSSSRCASSSPRPSASAIDSNTPGGPVPMESIHPTIMHDMRSFVSGTFFSGGANPGSPNFDFSQFEQQAPPPQQNQLHGGPSVPVPPVQAQRTHSNGYQHEYRPYPDIYLGEDLFGINTPSSFSAAGSSGASSSTTTPESMTNVPPPVLDATWQSFVEQLGF